MGERSEQEETRRPQSYRTGIFEAHGEEHAWVLKEDADAIRAERDQAREALRELHRTACALSSKHVFPSLQRALIEAGRVLAEARHEGENGS